MSTFNLSKPMQKGVIFDLSKETGYASEKFKVELGWDGAKYDLDIWIVGYGGGKENTCFFNQQKVPGLSLPNDARTGEISTQGADEYTQIDCSQLKKEKYAILVGIFEGKPDPSNPGILTPKTKEERTQKFSDIKNSFIRILSENNEELSNFFINENGGNAGCLHAADLIIEFDSATNKKKAKILPLGEFKDMDVHELAGQLI